MFRSVLSPCVFVHGPTRAPQDVIGLLKTSGDDGAVESRVGSRERSVFISVPQGLKVGGEITFNPGSQEDSTFVAGLSNPVKDNDTLDWVNDNEVTVFIKSVRNNASKGRVGFNEVLKVEKRIVIRELAFRLPEGFDNRVVGPENSPWQRARVISPGGDIEMRQSRHEVGDAGRVPFVLDLKTRLGFVDHTCRENIVARFRRRKRDRTVIDFLASRSNLHPCFRIRRKLGTGSSHDGEEVNCRVGRNDRQGNDGVECGVNKRVSKKEVGSSR